ncbi:hypothetical protein I6N96_10350 [Enterococcus sp. BWM-S5]|uniref:Uncharacterized protein n=1 Tax=Enterococcus larvae TaxID=2794352 RepID=A0ABS4CKY1_9ENTE|nr:hypothetical protein [Enterococcus larvae]MBP1046690.1 hypothetical protein [Enterococcus larvae]
MDKGHKSTMKSISKLITQSSHNFFSSFLEDRDSKDKKNHSKEREELLKELQLAAAQKALVVLQLKGSSPNQKFETVSGWIVSKNIVDAIMLRTQNDSQQIKMIPVKQIKKMSMLSIADKRHIK